jgi:hypothetical protein
MKQFNMDYVNNLHGANYFGCKMNGQSEELQEAIKCWWLDAMADRGFMLDDEPTDSKEFESACMESLNEVLGGVA